MYFLWLYFFTDERVWEMGKICILSHYCRALYFMTFIFSLLKIYLKAAFHSSKAFYFHTFLKDGYFLQLKILKYGGNDRKSTFWSVWIVFLFTIEKSRHTYLNDVTTNILAFQKFSFFAFPKNVNKKIKAKAFFLTFCGNKVFSKTCCHILFTHAT